MSFNVMTTFFEGNLVLNFPVQYEPEDSDDDSNSEDNDQYEKSLKAM
jgi:hypothetical protein